MSVNKAELIDRLAERLEVTKKDAGEIVSLDHFGASASAGHLFKEYGFTAENVAAAAKKSIAQSK